MYSLGIRSLLTNLSGEPLTVINSYWYYSQRKDTYSANPAHPSVQLHF